MCVCVPPKFTFLSPSSALLSPPSLHLPLSLLLLSPPSSLPHSPLPHSSLLPPSSSSSLVILSPLFSTLLSPPSFTDTIQRTLDPTHADSLNSTPSKTASAGANATSMEDHDDIVTSYKELIRDQVRMCVCTYARTHSVWLP